jgi:hypothetical protein
MADFPKLRTGAVAQHPSKRQVEYATRVLTFVGGGEQRWRERGAAGRRWVLRFGNVDDTEMAKLVEFFAEQRGRAGHFSFEDPWTGSVYGDCSFDQDQFVAYAESEGRLSAVVALRENA